MCGCLFKISAKWRALTGRRALIKKLLTCSDSFALESFSKVINKVAVETDFHCIPDYIRKWGSKGEGEPTRGGTCLILWPSGWAIVHGRALIKSKTLTQGNTVSGNLDFSWKISFFPNLVQNVCFLLGIRLFVWSIEKTSRTNLYNFGQTHVLRKRKLFQVVTCLRMLFFFAFQNQLQKLSQQKKPNLSLRVSDRKFIIHCSSHLSNSS